MSSCPSINIRTMGSSCLSISARSSCRIMRFLNFDRHCYPSFQLGPFFDLPSLFLSSSFHIRYISPCCQELTIARTPSLSCFSAGDGFALLLGEFRDSSLLESCPNVSVKENNKKPHLRGFGSLTRVDAKRI